jgi:hypothetical protein
MLDIFSIRFKTILCRLLSNTNVLEIQETAIFPSDLYDGQT